MNSDQINALGREIVEAEEREATAASYGKPAHPWWEQRCKGIADLHAAGYAQYKGQWFQMAKPAPDAGNSL